MLNYNYLKNRMSLQKVLKTRNRMLHRLVINPLIKQIYLWIRILVQGKHQNLPEFRKLQKTKE